MTKPFKLLLELGQKEVPPSVCKFLLFLLKFCCIALALGLACTILKSVFQLTWAFYCLLHGVLPCDAH